MMPDKPKAPPPPPYTPTRADAVTALDTNTPLGRESYISTGSTGLDRKASTKKKSLIGN